MLSMREKYFEAGNLYLATYLLFRGFPLRGTNGSGRLKKILFDNTPEVQDACHQFYESSETQRLFECYRRAKDYLFQNGM